MTSRFDAFISYSYGADRRLASAVQRCLHRLARPWYRPRALRVFRDAENLGANDDLWRTIRAQLTASRFFILLASPRPRPPRGCGGRSPTGRKIAIASRSSSC